MKAMAVSIRRKPKNAEGIFHDPGCRSDFGSFFNSISWDALIGDSGLFQLIFTNRSLFIQNKGLLYTYKQNRNEPRYTGLQRKEGGQRALQYEID
jgi:hypothetical protein